MKIIAIVIIAFTTLLSACEDENTSLIDTIESETAEIIDTIYTDQTTRTETESYQFEPRDLYNLFENYHYDTSIYHASNDD